VTVTKFCLDNSLIGTKQHLIVDDGSFCWSPKVPSRAWHLSGQTKFDSDRCLDTALKLSGTPLNVEPPEAFVKSMSVLTGSTGHVVVPWQKVMPAREHQSFIKRLINETVVAMDTAALDYYKGTWVTGNHVLSSLQPAAIDSQTWRDLVVSGEGNVAATRSFEPGPDGLAKVPRYDRFKTLTGRLTVGSGPQILTLKREHRSMIRSVYGEQGGIYSLDFAALEARILLYEYGRRCDEVDLYGMIARELGYDRKAIKGAVISELYGSSKVALGVHLGIKGKELDSFVANVKAYFNTRQLLERIKKQFVATGKVINRYGRPVVIDSPLDHIFISYYGQSTGVDVTMMGFKQVINSLAERAPKTRPIYVLHDALLLDIPNDELQIVEAFDQVKVKGYVQKFFLKLEKIT